MCWDVSVADRGICRGRCPHRPVPFFENENCRGEHCSPANFSRSRQPCPKENSCNPSGGIARTSLSALGLQTPLFALSCMYNAGILNICFEYSYCFLYGVCCACFSFVFLCKISHKEFLFFFSLLKRKKEAKKEKLPPTLVLNGNVSHDWQCATVPIFRTLLIKLYLSFPRYNKYWKPTLSKG